MIRSWPSHSPGNLPILWHCLQTLPQPIASRTEKQSKWDEAVLMAFFLKPIKLALEEKHIQVRLSCRWSCQGTKNKSRRLYRSYRVVSYARRIELPISLYVGKEESQIRHSWSLLPILCSSMTWLHRVLFYLSYHFEIHIVLEDSS